MNFRQVLDFSWPRVVRWAEIIVLFAIYDMVFEAIFSLSITATAEPFSAFLITKCLLFFNFLRAKNSVLERLGCAG